MTFFVDFKVRKSPVFALRKYGAFLMITRILYSKIWKDEFFAGLNPTEKLLFVYFIANERVNIIHCYEITDREILFDTGIDRGILEKAKQKFQDAGKISFYKNFVFLRNAGKYENYKGDKNDIAKEKLLSLMSNNVLDWYNNIKDRGIDTPLKGTINHKSEIINHNKGVVKGDSKLKEEDLQEISNKYKVPLVMVKLAKEEMDNWLEAKGKRYKNYKAGLRNWVLRDAKKNIEKTIERRLNDKYRPVDARHIK